MLDILGIWIGSPAKLPSLQREGIFRFLFNVVKHLALRHPIRFEIWCQHINLTNVREHFSPLLGLGDLQKRIVFCTELNAHRRFHAEDERGPRILLPAAAAIVHCMKSAIYFLKNLLRRSQRLVFPVLLLLLLLVLAMFMRALYLGRVPLWTCLPPLLLLVLFAFRASRLLLEQIAIHGWDFFKQIFNLLPLAANRYSNADCFLIQNFDMANAWKIDRLKVINLHDLFACEFAPLFAKSGFTRRLLFQGQKAVRYAGRLAADGSFFVSNSDHIRRNHALAFVPGLSEERSCVIFLPAIIPHNIRQKVAARDSLLAAFGIPGNYIFYPTHIRPYKNILTLLKAFKSVVDDGNGLTLVLTGILADDPDCLAFARQSGLLEKIVLTGEISEVDMYGLYRHAALAAVPTLAESSFPWQALEAMAMDIPVIVSRIPVVEERLRFHRLEAETCGLLMFEPRDEKALARMILHVLAHRAQVLSEQEVLRQTLLAYDWQQLGDRYFSLFTRLLEQES